MKEVYFNELDGVILYCIIRKKTNIYDIINSGDYLFRILLTYNEIDEGLNRLIANGFVEKHENYYRLSIKGKQFRKQHTKFYAPPIPEIVSWYKMFKTMKLEIIPNYDKHIFLEDEYKTAVKKYKKMFDKYLK